MKQKGLNKIGWTIQEIEKYSMQTDSWNCGVFCAQYLKILIESEGMKKKLSMKFQKIKAALKNFRALLFLY